MKRPTELIQSLRPEGGEKDSKYDWFDFKASERRELIAYLEHLEVRIEKAERVCQGVEDDETRGELLRMVKDWKAAKGADGNGAS